MFSLVFLFDRVRKMMTEDRVMNLVRVIPVEMFKDARGREMDGLQVREDSGLTLNFRPCIVSLFI